MDVSSEGGDASAGTNLEGEALKRKRRLEAMRQLREQEQQSRSQGAEEQLKLPRYPSINKCISNKSREV